VAAIVLAGGLLHARLVGEPSPAGRRALGRAALALAIVLPLEFGLTALRMYEVSGVSGAALVWDLLWARWGELWVLRCLGLAVLASSTRLDAALAAPWLLLRSFQGHAGAHGTVPALIDWLHLTAAAVWIGSLVQLALLPRPLAAAVAQRVRTLATLALAVLVPAGVYAAFLHVQRLDLLIRSPYGLALLVKLALAVVLVALLSTSTSAHALPAFARRFNLACGACHSAVPRLNAFGEAFHENGFKPPGTMWTPLPGTLSEAITQGMAVWTRGEFYERSDFARGPSPRAGLAVPEHASIYLAGPLTTSTSLFVELENTVHETDINKRGDFVNSDTGGMQKAFLMVDLPMLFGLHGGHEMDHEMHHHDMEMGMATMGDGLVGHGPMVMIGRVDPSTNFSYAVDRQLFHDLPADTSETGFLLRLALQPYAFGAKFFGIFKRGDHTLLPTEPTLYHTQAAPGIDVHGRLFASKVLYQFGLTTDAAPEFLDRIHTAAPYAMLRYDFGDEDGL